MILYNVAGFAVLALAVGWGLLRLRRQRAGLCPQCGRRPPDATLGYPYGTPLCGSCVEAQRRGSRAAVYVFLGLLASMLVMAVIGIAGDIRHGYKYGLKDLSSALFFLIALGPFIALVNLSVRHRKAAQTARLDGTRSGEQASPPGGPTTSIWTPPSIRKPRL